MRILGWLRDDARERQLARCTSRLGLQAECFRRIAELTAALADTDAGIVVATGAARDATVGEAVTRWMRGSPPATSPEMLGADRPGARISVVVGGRRGADAADGAPRLIVPARPSDLVLLSVLRHAVEVVRALGAVQSHAAQMSSTLSLTRQLAARHDYREILFTVVRHIAEVVHVDRASILVVEESAEEIRVVATSDDASLHDLRLALARYPEVREALARRAPVYVADLSTDPRLADVRRLFGKPPSTASTLFPILDARGGVLGLLTLRAAAGGRLTDPQSAACQAAADAAAPALANARRMRYLEHEVVGSHEGRLEAERQVHVLTKYAQFFESAADGLIVIDLAGEVLYVNPSAETLVGGGAVGLPRRLAEVFDEAGRESFAGLLAGFRAGKFPTVDMALPRADGDPRVVQISSSPVLHGDGACLLSIRDVTDERTMAAELQRTKTFLERVLDASVDGIVAADMKGTVILFNRGAERITGWRAGEVVGRMNISTLYGSRDQARELMARLRSTDHGGVGRLAQTRVTLRGRENEEISVGVAASIIYDGDQEIATCGIFTDLRERMRIEERLAQTQERLLVTEKQAIVSEVSGAMAHELNQPLTSVMGYAELLRKTLADDSRASRYVETILQETERMAELVKKIGRLSKYETKRYVGGTQILDLDRSSGESK